MDAWDVKRIINEEKNKPDGCATLAGLFTLIAACFMAWWIGDWMNRTNKRLNTLEQKAGIVKEQR